MLVYLFNGFLCKPVKRYYLSNNYIVIEQNVCTISSNVY